MKNLPRRLPPDRPLPREASCVDGSAWCLASAPRRPFGMEGESGGALIFLRGRTRFSQCNDVDVAVE